MKAYQEYKKSGVIWFNEIPKHWDSGQLKFRLSNNDGGVWGDDTEDEGTIVLRSTEIDLEGNWRIDNPAIRLLSDVEIEKALLKAGDLLITKSSGSESHIGKTALVTTEVEALKACYSNFMQRIRPNNQVNSRFLHYFMNSSLAREQYNYQSTTTTGLANLNSEIIGNLKIPFIPLPEQQAIADFLDRKTAQIDTLIAKKQRQIELLQEQRTALINHAVTKGLPKTSEVSETSEVSWKDSGVEWLGEIPSHWEVAKLSYLTERIGDGLHGTPEYVDTSDYYFINGNNLVKGEIQFFESTKCVSEDEFKKYDVGLNDKTILLSINGTIGNVAFYRGEKVMLGKSAAFIVFHDDLLKNYFFHYLQSTQIQNYFGLESTGTTIFNLSLKSIRSTPLPLPPDDEKKAIADYLDKTRLEFDKATDVIALQIAYLQEYRTALISEAVTGKIDVR